MITDVHSTIPESILELGTASVRPTYVYDMKQVSDRCREIEALPVARKSIFFATMANDHPAVLECIRDRGHGVFVNSLRHLRLAHSLSLLPERIVYAATNMTAEEMEVCLQLGVRVILDSLGQLKSFSEMTRHGQEVGLRLSVGSALDGAMLRDDPLYRFGLLPSELPAAVEIAARYGVRIVGAHSYFGTDLISANLLAEAMERLGRVADALPDLRYLDVGGGFGVRTHDGGKLDLKKYGELAAGVMRELEHRRGKPIELAVEPGRYLSASCGYFFVKVIDVKIRPSRVFVGTNGSVAIFPRPFVYPDRAVHHCEIVGPRGAEPLLDCPVYICGNSTYSQDFLARDVRLPLPRSGDSIVFHNAGAYCRSMITDFLGKDRPTEIVADSSTQPAIGSGDHRSDTPAWIASRNRGVETGSLVHANE